MESPKGPARGIAAVLLNIVWKLVSNGPAASPLFGTVAPLQRFYNQAELTERTEPTELTDRTEWTERTELTQRTERTEPTELSEPTKCTEETTERTDPTSANNTKLS